MLQTLLWRRPKPLEQLPRNPMAIKFHREREAVLINREHFADRITQFVKMGNHGAQDLKIKALL